ncbi:MAG: hypothetical protein LBE11_06245, partial [Prevotellaceae bacterium]|nr:hypothetical protein [Prevotellaceae bacterium]
KNTEFYTDTGRNSAKYELVSLSSFVLIQKKQKIKACVAFGELVNSVLGDPLSGSIANRIMSLCVRRNSVLTQSSPKRVPRLRSLCRSLLLFIFCIEFGCTFLIINMQKIY